ncbi:MAG: hypothetical protein JNG89_04890 [Planctomycetaceae bacterium]|nr:hypothetical protein [Planctomycetaceae bacterium]
MGSRDDHRWRDDFPQIFAAWMMTQTAARRATQESSPWTIIVVSGGLAVLLGFLLLFIDPSPKKTADASEALPLLRTGLTGRAASPLDVDVTWLRTASDWDESPIAKWTSTSVPVQTVAFAMTDADGWNAPSLQPEFVATTVPEPYWMRVTPIRYEDLTAALESSETPRRFSTPEFEGSVNVTIERTPAMPTETGSLAYTLHVQNLARDGVEHVRVIETLPFPEHVTDTAPPATMTQDGAFVWELSNLRGFETRDLTVTLDAAQIKAPLETLAALEIQTPISVKTWVAAAALPPSSEPITPELALPEPEPTPVAESFSEPITPLLADEPPAVAPDWSPYDPRVPPEDAMPIEPLFTQDIAPVQEEEFTPLPAEDVQQFEPITPEFTPDPVPARDIAEESVTPEPAHTPRPLPLGTQKPRPVLTLNGNSREAVRTGDIVTTVYEIVNAGDVPADGVVLTVFVPPELQHKHGERVEHRIDRLLPGQSHSARLLTRASATGTAKLDAILSVEGEAEDEHVISVRVLGPRPANVPRQ